MQDTEELRLEELHDAAFPQLLQLISGYQMARALLAANELSLVDLLQDGPRSSDDLAEATDTHPPSMHRFLRALTSLELFTEQNGLYDLGPLAPALRNAATALIGLESYQAWGEIPYSLRTGNPAFERVHGKQFYEWVGEDPDRTKRFDDAMIAFSRAWIPAVMEAYDFGGINTLADLGGGTGTFISTVLKTYPHMRGILFDQPHVVEHASSVLEAAGVANRCDAVGGSLLEGIPSGANSYSLCNVVADFGDEQVVAIFKNCYSAIAEGGKLLVVDWLMPSPDSPNHRDMAFFDLFFLVLQGGRMRTQAEHEELFVEAGFRLAKVIPTSSVFCVLEAVPTND